MESEQKDRTKWKRIILVQAFLFWFIAASQVLFGQDSKTSFNVLFIAIDDLRPTLGCYGDEVAQSPNIDRLARQSILFKRAYCQMAVCSPSRLSLLTGMRPDKIKVWDLKTHFRDAVPDAVTLPQLFKNHGYLTKSLGKIFHGGGRPAKDPPSWSVPPKFDVVRDAAFRYATSQNLEQQTGLKRNSSEMADVPDNQYIDGVVCDAALKAIESFERKKSDTRQETNRQPFFLAVGFRKPHLPFCAPEKYWSMYKRDEIPEPKGLGYPANAPELATRSWQELEGYSDIKKLENISPEKRQELRHGYYACVSYIDLLVGKLLDKLDKCNLRENTIVVVWGDHGFHLGEQGIWTKANNYELSTRVPLMFSVPGQTDKGLTTDSLVELVDVYPTLAQLCGLDMPRSLDGDSLVPLLRFPNLKVKDAAYSQFPRVKKGHRHSGRGDIMGYAIRTDRFRYVQWRDNESNLIEAEELYDHMADPKEQTNVASKPVFEKLLADLRKQVVSGKAFQMKKAAK